MALCFMAAAPMYRYSAKGATAFDFLKAVAPYLT
jgi:hypothetical protein